MRNTYKDIMEFKQKATKHIDFLKRQPFISSQTIYNINKDTGGLLKDSLDMLMIPSLAGDSKTGAVINILTRFIGSTQDVTTCIDSEYAGELISAYSVLVVSDEFVNLPVLNDIDSAWCEDNMFVPIIKNGLVENGSSLKLRELLADTLDPIGGFIEDSMLIDSLRKSTEKYGGILAETPLMTLVRSMPIGNYVLKDFYTQVFESEDKTEICMNNAILERILLSVNPSTLLVLELVSAIITKIKEVQNEG